MRRAFKPVTKGTSHSAHGESMTQRTKYLPLVVVAALAFGACDDMLTETPKSTITSENYYRTADQIENATVAMYAALAGEWDFFKIQQHWTFELPSDQGRFHPDEPNVETQAPQFLNWTSTSRDAIQPWRMHFMNLMRAHIVLEFAPQVDFTDAAHQRALIAEAKFMRAFHYFWLTRIYNGVPLYTSLAEQRAGNVPRATEAEVLAQVIQDLSEAAADLPLTRPANQKGRATRGAAMALLADAYRWRANVHGNSQADWQASAAAAKDVIDSGVYSLVPNYLDAFLPGSELRSEEIFAVQFANIGWFGIDLWNGVYFARNIPGVEGWAVVVPTPQFYHSYPQGDYRHQVIFRTKACADGSDDGCAEADKIDFTPHNFEGFSTRGHPHVWKYRPTGNGANFWGAGDANGPMYRFADVLLMYAEAQFELGNSAAALASVNQVRARARQGTGAETRSAPADLATISKDIIYQERSWELAYELKRWFDLVQRGESYFSAQLLSNDPLSNGMGLVRGTHMRLPIPAEEIAKNPLLEQNPGY
jgi:starch-binding outer membrane protein, SusD/RagB family